MPYTSKWAGRLNADYVWERGSGIRPSVGASLVYRCESRASLVGPRLTVFNQSAPNGIGNLYRLSPYALVDLRAGIESADGRCSVSVFGQSVGNKFYVTSVNNANDVIVRYVGAPATYRIVLSFKN